MTPHAEAAPVERWIFFLQVRSRPGVLSALTAVFADRGVSIETLTAHDSSSTGAPYGTVLLTFAASEAKKDYLARLLARSANVQDVAEYRYDDAEHTRKSVLVRVRVPAAALTHALPAGILCDVISAKAGETLAMLLGPPVQIDEALAALAPRAGLEASEPTITVV